ncbi:MAG: hypothetical protein U1F98_07220 [Verrucomicrobiota bacterium]
MFTRIGNIFLIVALLAATGGHWALLQTVAWAGMLADNLKTTSISQAVERTFDGKHPCPLCRQIAEGKKAEKKSEFPLELKKFEFLSAAPKFIFASPTQFRLEAVPECFSESVLHSPPTPPPRRFFV